MPQTIKGMKIKDAKRGLPVRIEARDIKGSKRREPDACAAARAIMRQCEVDDARVYRNVVYARHKGQKHYTRYRTPTRVREELIAFDRGGSFEPVSVTLLPPSIRNTGKQQGSKTNQTNPHRDRIHEPKHPPVLVDKIRRDAQHDLKGRK